MVTWLFDSLYIPLLSKFLKILSKFFKFPTYFSFCKPTLSLSYNSHFFLSQPSPSSPFSLNHDAQGSSNLIVGHRSVHPVHSNLIIGYHSPLLVQIREFQAVTLVQFHHVRLRVILILELPSRVVRIWELRSCPSRSSRCEFVSSSSEFVPSRSKFRCDV